MVAERAVSNKHGSNRRDGRRQPTVRHGDDRLNGRRHPVDQRGRRRHQPTTTATQDRQDHGNQGHSSHQQTADFVVGNINSVDLFVRPRHYNVLIVQEPDIWHECAEIARERKTLCLLIRTRDARPSGHSARGRIGTNQL